MSVCLVCHHIIVIVTLLYTITWVLNPPDESEIIIITMAIRGYTHAENGNGDNKIARYLSLLLYIFVFVLLCKQNTLVNQGNEGDESEYQAN